MTFSFELENDMDRRKFISYSGKLILSCGLLSRCAGSNAASYRKSVVIGVGGAGIYILNEIPDLRDKAFAVDADNSKSGQRTRLEKITFAMEDADMDDRPEMVRASVEHILPGLKRRLASPDQVILVAGLGGATGTNASPAIARTASEAGARVVGLWIHPFSWESRCEHAACNLPLLRNSVDTSIDFRLEDFSLHENMHILHIFQSCISAVTDTVIKLHHA